MRNDFSLFFFSEIVHHYIQPKCFSVLFELFRVTSPCVTVATWRFQWKLHPISKFCREYNKVQLCRPSDRRVDGQKCDQFSKQTKPRSNVNWLLAHPSTVRKLHYVTSLSAVSLEQHCVRMDERQSRACYMYLWGDHVLQAWCNVIYMLLLMDYVSCHTPRWFLRELCWCSG